MSDGFTDQDRNQLHEFMGRVDEKLNSLPCDKAKDAIVKLDRRAKSRGMFLGNRVPIIIEAGIFPTQEKDMYI